mmetsp:Transcript_30657/g.49619  ORF Transcript_30657/g.49619 Transcript_30657/m.49619 type:complete len:232 (-) Transcript_30657:93-788(-)
MIQITVGGGGQLKGTEANIIQGLIVDDHNFVGVFYKLMYRESGIVWLHDGIRHLGRRENGESLHNSVRIFLSDLGNKKRSHAGTSSTTQRMSNLETLQTVAALRFLSYNVQNRIDQLSTLCIVSLCPVVASARLTENEIVWAEELTIRTSADGVHGTRLEIHQDSSRNISPAGSFVEVDIYSLKLQIAVAMVCSGWVDAVLIRDNLPEFGTNLVAALTSLNVDDFSHFRLC